MLVSKKFLTILVFCLTISQSLLACKPTPKTTESLQQNLKETSNIFSNDSGNPKLKLGKIENDYANQANTTATSLTACNNQAIYRAFSQRNENQKIQVLGCGRVKKVLPDDNDGTRHQKFLLTVDGYPQISVLVAHNIDIAKRVDNIAPNTPITFYGEYIYNDKGGMLHWTHKDPAARHQDGWLMYNGQKYW